MHRNGVGMVVIHDVHRYAFPEIGLDGVHAGLRELPDLFAEPAVGFGIREIHNRHTRLPHVALEYRAVRIVQKIALFRELVKDLRTLRDVRVDPDADAQPPVVQSCKLPLRVGEHLPIPLKARPCERLHPEAVEMEHRQRNVTRRHAVHESVHRLLVVVGRERRGKPEPERSCGRKCGLSGQVGVADEHILQCIAAEQVVFDLLAGERHAELGHRVGCRLKAHTPCAVDENAVPAAGQTKRDGFIALCRAGAAVGIPDVHGLPVLDKGRELLAEAVKALTHVKGKLLADVAGARICRIVEEPVAALRRKPCIGAVGILLDIGGAAPRAAGQDFSVTAELHTPLHPAVYAHGDLSGVQLGEFVGLRDRCLTSGQFMQLKLRLIMERPLVMDDMHLDDILRHSRIRDLQRHAAQSHAAVIHRDGYRKNSHGRIAGGDLICLRSIMHLIAAFCQPQSVRELHFPIPFVTIVSHISIVTYL